MEKELVDLEVYDDTGNFIGAIEVETFNPDDVPNSDMPEALEINGVYYYPQF